MKRSYNVCPNSREPLALSTLVSTPAPLSSLQWEFATNKDGLLTTNNGITDITIRGTNENNGFDFFNPSEYAVVYAYFQQPTFIFLDWQFSSNDGIDYDDKICFFRDANEEGHSLYTGPPNTSFNEDQNGMVQVWIV